MSVMRKLCTLARGATRESAQVILDANAQRVFEQEILDVEKAIQVRKQALCEVIASRKQIKSEAEGIQALIEKRESQAQRLIRENKDGDLVEDIAKEIADHEKALELLANQRVVIDKRIHNMEYSLHKALKEVTNYRRDLRMASVQQMSASGLSNTSSLPQQLSELEATRKHLVSLQASDDNRDEAWVEMEDRVESGNIDSRLDRIGESENHAHFNEVLERLRRSG